MTDKEIVEWYKETTSELGIDLITLFKTLKNGTKFSGENETIMNIPFQHIEFSPSLTYGFSKKRWRLKASGYERETKDYGKTWWLTKEELEK